MDILEMDMEKFRMYCKVRQEEFNKLQGEDVENLKLLDSICGMAGYRYSLYRVQDTDRFVFKIDMTKGSRGECYVVPYNIPITERRYCTLMLLKRNVRKYPVLEKYMIDMPMDLKQKLRGDTLVPKKIDDKEILVSSLWEECGLGALPRRVMLEVKERLSAMERGNIWTPVLSINTFEEEYAFNKIELLMDTQDRYYMQVHYIDGVSRLKPIISWDSVVYPTEIYVLFRKLLQLKDNRKILDYGLNWSIINTLIRDNRVPAV